MKAAVPSNPIVAAAEACRRLGATPHTVDILGTSMFLAKAGGGVPLVALHGLQSCFYTWRHLLAHPPFGHEVIAIDLPGFGASGDANTNDLTNVLEAILQHLNVGPAVLCGHSYGALPCLDLTVRRPDLVRALVLIGSPLPGTPKAKSQITQNLMLYAYADLSVIEEEVFRVYRAIGMRTPGAIQAETTFPPLNGPLPTGLPCLNIRGDSDRIVSAAYHDDLAQLLPLATNVEMPQTGHCPHEERPAEFHSLLADFLATLPDSVALSQPLRPCPSSS